MRWLMLVLLTFLSVIPIVEAKGRRSTGGTTSVRPSVDRTGTYRQGHFRTAPNNSRLDNWSTKGNANPYTGKKGTRNPW